MSNNYELVKGDKGKILNLTLGAKWKAYYEAEDELAMVKEELIMESLRAKAEGHSIPGITVTKGSTRPSNPGIKEIFEQKGWAIIEKPTIDYTAMKQKLIDEDISIPLLETGPTAYKKAKKSK